MADTLSFSTDKVQLRELLPVLHWLDQLLQQAVIAAQALYDSTAVANGYQGLYISPEEIDRVFGREAGTPTLPFEQAELRNVFASLVNASPRLTWLAKTFDLSDFDLALMVIALAPEIDLRYERLYGYLQDDVTRKRASIDLALNLLCPSGELKLHRRAHFAAHAPLIRDHLLHLIADPHQPQPPELAYSLKLDEQILHWLLGQPGLDSRLTPFCQLVESTVVWESLPLNSDVVRAVRSLIHQSRVTDRPIRFYFHGQRGVGKQQMAEAIAHALKKSLLVVNLTAILSAKTTIEFPMFLVFREAQLQHHVLYLKGLDAIDTNEQSVLQQQLFEAISHAPGITILAGRQPWIPTTTRCARLVIPVHFPIPDVEQRRICWQMNLTELNLDLSASDLDTLADRFRLTPDQIADAVAIAHSQARWQHAQTCDAAPPPISPSLQDLFAAARQQSGEELRTLARKVEPHYRWEDIVLPPDPLTQLKELCNQVKYHHLVYQTWGFERRLSLGKGLNVLFSGSPGTGKTMAAEVIANELQLDLYRIDLSQVVSKYIGETEKNLDRIFTAAETSNAILLFDEADALFGKRSEVKDAHDRYANLEVAYLLQKMEAYEGITILTTNLRQNLDEAFTRRIRFMIEFPFPEAEHRLQIWQVTLPRELPLASDVNLELLAQHFRLAGGNIRNIALAAAFLAAEANQAVSMEHLLQATKRELQKLGRLVGDDEFLKFNPLHNET